jgi:hypothetical protein
MNVRINSTDLREAINDYIRKKGINGTVTQVSYTDRQDLYTEVSEAIVLFDKDKEASR